MSIKKIGRKEREYLAHRGEILSAAEKVFAEKGFFLTTMREIAEAAEFGTGTLYNYFKSKEELYLTLIDGKVEEINRLVKAGLCRKASAIERVQKVLGLEFEFIEQNRDFFRIYISERNLFEWTVKSDLRRAIHDKMMAYIQVLAQVMRQGIKEREFKPMDPMDLAYALVGIVRSFVFEWLINPQSHPLRSKAGAVLEIFLKGIQKIERRR